MDQNIIQLPQIYHKEFYQKAILLYSQKQYDQAVLFFEKCVQSQENKLFYYKDAATCYLTLQMYQKVVDVILLGFKVCDINTNDVAINSTVNNMNVMLYLSLKCIGQHQQAEQIQSQLPETIKIQEFNQKINERINKQQINLNERKEQAQFVYDQLQKMKIHNYEGILFYLIPIGWFENWKAYTQFDSINNEDYIVEEDNDRRHPGPLIVDSLIEQHPNQIIDPVWEENSTNFILKKNIIENQDFIIVNAAIASRLHECYKGQLLSRQTTLEGLESKQTARVEIRLKQINFFILPSIMQDQNYQNTVIYRTQAYSNTKISKLQEKIQNIVQYLPLRNPEQINDKQSIKIWKINRSVEYITNKFYERQENKGVVIKGEVLKADLKLDDVQICDEDILLIEFKQEEGWIFKSQEQQNQQSEMENNFQMDVQQQMEQSITNVIECCAKCGAEDGEIINQKQVQLQISCSCKMVKYCSQTCQKQDIKTHAKIHGSVEESYEQKNKVCKFYKIRGNFNENPSGQKGLVGLQNLGNTCFMNSSLQCLSNCYELTQYFLRGQFYNDMNTSNPLGTKGWLTGAYYEMLQNIWQGNSRSFSPYNFKKVIGQFAPQFSGYNQQDSQELLSYVLDGLHEDLNKVKQKPIIEQLESDGTNDNFIAQKSWKNYLKRNQSIITDLLVGQFKSTLNCPDCKRISVTFDPFMSLSLPVPQQNIQRKIEFYLLYRDTRKSPLKITLTADQNTTKLQLNKLMTQWDPSLTNLRQYYYDLLKIKSAVTQDQTIVDIDNEPYHMFMMQTYDEQFERVEDKHAQLIELQIYKRGKLDKPFSFSRVFFTDYTFTYQQFYMSVYKTMRKYIFNYFEDKTSEKIVDINLEDNSDENIKDELEQFNRLNKLPFNIKLADQNIKLDYKNTKNKLIDIKKFAQKKNQVVEFTFSDLLDIQSDHKMLKINTCDNGKIDQNEIQGNDSKPTLNNCLKTFIKPEILEKGNEWYCSQCKDHKCAEKIMQIQKLPKYLILHLKRFKTGGVKTYGRIYYEGQGEKIKTLVQFPLKDIDLTEFVLDAQNSNEKYIYDVIGVSNHIGNMGYGHYTAYVKSPINDQWYDYNDSSVTQQDENSIVTNSSYVLFLKRKNI